MDKIWDRKSFEVGGHWPLWRGLKNRMTRRTDKSRTLKKTPKTLDEILVQMKVLCLGCWYKENNMLNNDQGLISQSRIYPQC